MQLIRLTRSSLDNTPMVLSVGALVFLAACTHSSTGLGNDAGGSGAEHDFGTGGSGGESGTDLGTSMGQDDLTTFPPIDAGPCAMRLGARGLSSRMMTYGGATRKYLVYLPQALDPTRPVPLVLAHHGWQMSGDEMRRISDYTTLADKEGFAVVFPEGEEQLGMIGPWNIGDTAKECPTLKVIVPGATGDDLGFLDAMQADVKQDQCIDPGHVFVTGFSMGGYFSHHVGCMKPDIRAVAPHSGGAHDLSACPVARKPIIIFHGDADDLIPDGCDDPSAASIPTGFDGKPVVPSATAWAQHNGCGTTVATVPVMNGECRYYNGCPADGQVALCILKGMKHCWAGGPMDPGGNSCPGFASATQLQWDFFKKYAW